jgi:hypothetical protein
MEVSRDFAIAQTLADSKYNYMIEEIIQDDYYKDGPSSYDPVIGRLQRDMYYFTSRCKENRDKADLMITAITNAMKDPKDKDYKYATNDEISRWELECSKLQLAFVTYKDKLEQIQPKLDDCLFNRFVEDGRRRTMKMLREKFFTDNDKEYLAKGITWAMEYAEKNRVTLDLDTLPKC